MLYFVLSLVWAKTMTQQIQKVLLLVPVFKFLSLLTFTVYAAQCPWHNQIEAKYLSMAFITLSTVYRTIFVTIILLLCKGWHVCRLTIPRHDVSTLTVLMGATYLCNSAYYVSVNSPNLELSVTIILNVLNSGLFIICLKNSIQVTQFLRQ